MARPTPPSRLMESVWVASPPDALTLAVSFRAHVLFGSLHVLTYHETSWRNPRLNIKCDNKQDKQHNQPYKLNQTKSNSHAFSCISIPFLILSNSLSIGISHLSSLLGFGYRSWSLRSRFLPLPFFDILISLQFANIFLVLPPLGYGLISLLFLCDTVLPHPPSILSLSPSYALLASHSRPHF